MLPRHFHEGTDDNFKRSHSGQYTPLLSRSFAFHRVSSSLDEHHSMGRQCWPERSKGPPPPSTRHSQPMAHGPTISPHPQPPRIGRAGSPVQSSGMEEPTPAEVVHAALDALLDVVAASAEDLRRFHDAVTKARLAPLPPFPRTSVLLTKHIIEHLTLVDQELEDILMALGVTRAPE